MRNLSPYLVGHWKGIKDENGLLHDFSGNGNHGTITNALMVDGKFGQAMRFDGTDDQVLVADDSAIRNIFDGGGSISCWIRVDSDGENNEGLIWSKTCHSLRVLSESNGKTKIKFFQSMIGTDGIWTSTATEIPLGGYVFVVLTYDNSDIANNPVIYVNGSSVALTEDSAPAGTRRDDIIGNLYIGDNAGSTRCFDGDIEDLRFYYTELTAAEVLTLSKQTPRSLITTPSTKMRRYFEFNGSNDYLSHVDDAAFDIGLGDALFEAWIKTSSSMNQTIMTHLNSGTSDRVLFWLVGGGLCLYLNDGTNVKQKITAKTVDDAIWHHVAATVNRSNGDVKLYIDAALEGEDDFSSVALSIDPAGSFMLGYRNVANYFIGDIAFAKMYYFGKAGLPTGSGNTPADYFIWRYTQPYAALREFNSGAWRGYEDADADEILNETDFATHAKWHASNDWDDTGGNGHYQYTSAQTSYLSQTAANRLKPGENDSYYEFIYTIAVTIPPDGTIRLHAPNFVLNNIILDITDGTHRVVFLSNISAATATFYITANPDNTQGDFTIDDVSCKRVGERGNWHLDGTNSFKAPDETRNALDLIQTDVTKQPSVVYDLGIKMQFEPLFYDPLNDQKLSNRWIVESGAFEPVYESSAQETCIKCTTDGVIGIPIPEQMQDLTKQNLEWTWRMYKGGANNYSFVLLVASVIDAFNHSNQNGYTFQLNNVEKIVFATIVNGGFGQWAYTADSYININTWYECRVTRSAAGVFTFYLDDIIVAVVTGTNPMTDITTTTTKYIVFDLDAGDMIANPKVVRY